jgi:methyl-accepting chemotaxis protein
MNDLSSVPSAPSPETASNALLDRVTQEALHLGRDIVEVAAVLDSLAQAAEDQLKHLAEARQAARAVEQANAHVTQDAAAVHTALGHMQDAVQQSVAKMHETGEHARKIAAWVKSVVLRMAEVTDTLETVQSENSGIRSIATQVNILAINAKIEAVRAGDAGRGFAVVAEAINELSRKTAGAAEGIGTAVAGLSQGIQDLRDEAETISQHATQVLESAEETDQSMGQMTASVGETRGAIEAITTHSAQVSSANTRFAPAFARMSEATEATVEQVHTAQTRTNALIVAGETIVQNSVMLGGAIEDARIIELARQTATEIGARFAQAVSAGRISEAALFDQAYTAVPHSNPAQVTTRFTQFTDTVLPPLQEPLLESDPRIIFCAAVDRNGYLPTHNRKFSQPQGKDPEWNAANCRNRRIFNDRVGLRAGKSTAPFVLQIYRRDMGGGAFALMKDLSAPIYVNGRHWGGFRIGYKF